MKRTHIVAFFLALLCLVPLTALAQTSPVQNAGFEGAYRNVDGAGELTVADQWWPGYDGAVGKRCEWKPETQGIGASRVRTGTYAQKWFTTYSPHRCWIYQRITGLEKGQIYRLTAWVWVWSSSQNNPDESIGAGKMWVKVGANPWGDTYALHESTTWGTAFVDVYDQWLELEVVFRAASDSVTVFLYSRQEFGARHGDVYWDDVLFLPLEGEGPAPTPTPCPACPTPEPCPTLPVEPTRTPAPGSCPSLGEIEDAVERALDQRKPVRWP